jgi:integrase
MGDSVPKHTGPISLTDTHPRTEHLQNPTEHHPTESQRWRGLFLRDAQAVCRCNCWASKSTPFFQMVKLMAAIFRARVRRAMVGRIPLIVVGSLRIGEVAALRWQRTHPDRIDVVERFCEGEFDDTKTDAGRRSIPLDSFGILRNVLESAWQRSKHRNPGDLVFTNARGGPINRRNLLRRQLKPTLNMLGLPATVDFRSFRTMHSSLMSSVGVRPEVTRDNMGHATIDVTQNA